MVTHNVDLMTSARESMKGRWNLLIRAVSIFILIEVCSGFISWLVDSILPITSNTDISGKLLNIFFSIGYVVTYVFISGPLFLGFTNFCLSVSLSEEVRLSQIFFGFKNFRKSVPLYFLIHLFSLLWTLLLIIPGIIAELSYAMAPFIMIEDSSVSPIEAIRKSKQMMNGYKGKLFGLNFRFALWFIFSILTLGIGLFWTIPYYYVTLWKFYYDIKAESSSVVNESVTH